MKTFLFSVLTLFLSSAEASYYQNDCSNADSSLRWSEGMRETRTFLSVLDENERDSRSDEFGPDELIITLSKKKILGREIQRGTEEGTKTWFSGKMRISPKPQVDSRFRKLFPAGKVEDFVICTEVEA